MGIRINKVLGYAITDFKKNDPRWESSLNCSKESSMPEYLQWVTANKAAIAALFHRECPNQTLDFAEEEVDFLIHSLSAKETDVGWCILTHYNSVKNVICFTPPEYPDWRRHDDIIDYVEARAQIRNRLVKIKRSGIYPHEGVWIRAREPIVSFADSEWAYTRRVSFSDDKGPVTINASDYSMLIGTWSKRMEPLAKGAFLEHLRNDFRPKIPVSIISLVLWWGKAKDPAAFINDLRPVLYTYWR